MSRNTPKAKSGAKKALPRYRQLAESLMADIRRGKLAVGERMPGELELVDMHGVSRHTVRASLKVLEELGLIERHQGLGTVVKAQESAPTYVQHMQSPAELMQYPSDSRLKVVHVEQVKTSRALARQLKCRSGTRWTRIDAIRRLRGSRLPICWSSIYVRPEFADITSKIGRSSIPVYEILERTFGEQIETVEVDFKAGIVSEAVADRLGVAPGSPSLTLVRRYLGRGKRQLEISVSEHPADNFNYTLTLRRGWQSGSGWSEG
ncbi:MAG: GntR family transcriptional regulator [Gammaproteobacteria bacterium]